MSTQTKQPWEINPEEYARDADGNFILKKDGTPRKKNGKKKGSTNKYHYHSETKARQRTRRSISKQKKDLEKLEKKVSNKRRVIRKKVEVAKTLDGKSGKAVLAKSDLDYLPPTVKEQIESGESRVAFEPNPGPQTDFLASSEKDVLYGGAAGGGKSYALLIDAIRYAWNKNHRPLLLRNTLDELEELIEKSQELYPLAFPGAEYKETRKTWIFPSGCRMKFGYLEKDSDVYRYQGKAYTWIGYDELTTLATPFAWNYLRSRCRSTDPFLKDKCVMRATANPGGIGHEWVKKMYVEPAAPNTTFWQSFVGKDGRKFHISRKFIPAKLHDNPYLADGGEYESSLMSLDPIERERLLNGDWDIADGAAFPEFNPAEHVIPPFEIPSFWERFKAVDYGYRAESCCLWFAIDPSDGTLVVYRELYEKGLTGTQLGIRMHEMEEDEPQSILGVLDWAVWDKRGNTGPTIGEEILKTRHKFRRADKNREAGKIQIHERLRRSESGRPKVQIFQNCINLIKQLKSIPLDKKNKEDVDTKAEDHAYDAFRYGVMSRPRMDDPFTRRLQYKTDVFQPSDDIFGY